MRLAVTGFVSEQAGSVASANALLLRALLDRGFEVAFFSKSSFVDPRPAAGGHPNFRFVEVDNKLADRTRARLARVPVLNFLSGRWDAGSYNSLLLRKIAESHKIQKFDLCLWLGDYSYGAIPGIPTVSFAQGPPGTDARSLIERFDEISRLAGPARARKWRLTARLRLSSFGTPNLAHSDLIIVGSQQSATTLRKKYDIPAKKIEILPYPVDLQMFDLSAPVPHGPELRCLWLGRIVPRKRLDLFLDGAALAIKSGVNLRLTITGGVGFIPGYEKLIEAFPYPDRLIWHRFLSRDKVPALLKEHDVLAQPSEEENFGSSVAEAQACGLPVIVGATNGNADYLCPRDIRLADYRPETFAAALADFARRLDIGDPRESRHCAEDHFRLDRVADKFASILRSSASLSA